MKLTVRAEALRNSLNKILTIIDRKNPRPVLKYTKIIAEKKSLILLATDLEVSVQIIIDAFVEKEGTFCTNAKNIFDILREMPDEDVSFELNIENNENILKLTCKSIHYSLLVYKSEDFPNLVFENKNNTFKVNTKELFSMINKTAHAISHDETRLYLNGLFFQEFDSRIRTVATDGHRLALMEAELDTSKIAHLQNGIIIPKKGVYELRKMVEAYPESTINFSLDDAYLYARIENSYYLSIRLIAKEYPKYQTVIPSKTIYSFNVDLTAFSDAVRRVKVMANEKSNRIKLHLKPSEMTISASNVAFGDAYETVQITYNGKEMEIGFNAKYLLDSLTSFDNGIVTIELNNQLSPVIIKSSTLPNFLGVIMPLRL